MDTATISSLYQPISHQFTGKSRFSNKSFYRTYLYTFLHFDLSEFSIVTRVDYYENYYGFLMQYSLYNEVAVICHSAANFTCLALCSINYSSCFPFDHFILVDTLYTCRSLVVTKITIQTLIWSCNCVIFTGASLTHFHLGLKILSSNSNVSNRPYIYIYILFRPVLVLIVNPIDQWVASFLALIFSKQFLFLSVYSLNQFFNLLMRNVSILQKS